MGLVGYYKRFMRKFSWIYYPITSLQRKGNNFEWTDECASKFDTLKKFITNALVLKIGDPNKEILVFTDACKRGPCGFLI